MAINMMCTNSRCEFYWEDCCTKSLNDERIEINGDGKCETFKAGISEWYEDIKNERSCDNCYHQDRNLNSTPRKCSNTRTPVFQGKTSCENWVKREGDN